MPGSSAQCDCGAWHRSRKPLKAAPEDELAPDVSSMARLDGAARARAQHVSALVLIAVEAVS